MSRLLAVLSILFAPAVAAAQPARMNVLFIPVDDLRPALGCAGDVHAKTPNINKLAARGTVFTRAYCQQAVCSPSRSSFLTGRRPDTTKVYDLVTHFRDHIPDVVTLPQHFKNNGYYVHGIGKVYHGGYNDEKSWSVPWEAPKGAGYGPEGRALNQKAMAEAKAAGRDPKQARGPAFEAPDVPDDELNDGKLAARGCELLRELKGKKEPFFLAVGFLKPHLPFVAPKKYWDLYDPAKLPTAPHPHPPKGAPAYSLTNSGELRAYHGIPKDGPIPDETAKKLVHGYYAAVSFLDAQVGKLLDELDRQGLRDSTAVVLWGDHGWHLNDHGQWCKHTNYEVATRAALVVSVPGQKVVGKPCNRLVEFVDVYPTLSVVCKLPAPEGVEGHSFAPLLDDPERPWKPAALSQYPRGSKETGPLMGYAIRTDRYRLVEWRERKTGKPVAHELYDHQADPGEDVNIAGSNKELVEKLSAQLRVGWKGNGPPK
jgi:iduronate 2-sulfatase